MDKDQNFFKKNGYLLKKNLIDKKMIDKINKVVNEVVAQDKQKNKNAQITTPTNKNKRQNPQTFLKKKANFFKKVLVFIHLI